MNTLILASASPRRKKIMEELGLPFEVVVPAVDEVFNPANPWQTVQDNARLKNLWCRERHPAAWIISADTLVAFSGHGYSKPTTREEAYRFMHELSGQTHSVFTGVACGVPGRDHPDVFIDESRVTFRPLTDADIAAYFERVDPMDKAGAYDVDQYGEMIIESYSGSHTNIMGLPRALVKAWLASHFPG